MEPFVVDADGVDTVLLSAVFDGNYVKVFSLLSDDHYGKRKLRMISINWQAFQQAQSEAEKIAELWGG